MRGKGLRIGFFKFPQILPGIQSSTPNVYPFLVVGLVVPALVHFRDKVLVIVCET